MDGLPYRDRAGVVRPCHVGMAAIENNLVELMAVVEALEFAASEKRTRVSLYTDCLSAFTRCQRPHEARMRGVPFELVARLRAVREAVSVDLTLLAGHPTAAALLRGYKEKKSGKQYPVSAWNVRADALCQAVMREAFDA